MSNKESARSLILISATHGLSHFYILIPPMALPLIIREFSLSHYEAGIFVGAFGLSYAILHIPFGHFSEKISRKWMIILGMLLYSAAMVMTGLSSIFWQLLLAQFLAGIGGATYHPAGISLISDLFQKRKGEAMGYHQIGGAVGSFMSPLLTGAIIASMGWRASFLIQSVYAVALVPALLLVNEPIEKRFKDDLKNDHKISVRDLKGVIMFIVATTIYLLGFRGLNAFAPSFFIERRGFDVTGSALMFSVLQIAGIFGGPVCGRLSDIFGRKKLILGLVIAQAILLSAIAIFPVLWLLIPVILYGFIVFGVMAASDAYAVELLPKKLGGAMLGLYISANNITAAMVPPAAGKIIDIGGYEITFLILSLITLLGIPFLLLIKNEIEN